ncbi:MAG: hypothetical protein GTO18_07465 [Anaerolineales bacterium]|nr:hypothetical protein [Anaerolineales bacterium]
MKCHEVEKLIPAYLDEELSPSEKKLMQTHLAECRDCTQELEVVGNIQGIIRQHLNARAATAAPQPQAWSLLRASLPANRRNQSALEKIIGSISVPDWFSVGRFSAARVTIGVLVLILLVAVAPPVWARLEPVITNWFSFISPDEESRGGIGGFTAFTPYHATYLPDGFQHSLLGGTTSVSPEWDAIEIGYDHNEKFIMILQSKGVGVTGLPTGESKFVRGEPAVFIPFFATSQEELSERRPEISIVTNYDYENTHLLAWFLGDIKIEVISNITLEEIFKVAESLEPMYVSEGEFPFPDR